MAELADALYVKVGGKGRITKSMKDLLDGVSTSLKSVLFEVESTLVMKRKVYIIRVVSMQVQILPAAPDSF